MYKQEPTGKYLLSVCKSISCEINNSNSIIDVVKDFTGLNNNETDEEGLFLIDKVPFGRYFLVIEYIGYEDKIIDDLVNEEEGSPKSSDLMDVFKKIEKTIVRSNLIKGEPRIDGRDLDTVRPLFIEAGVLKNTHGSALFTRGETQALVAATLGSPRQAQLIDALEGEFKDQFMLHYNFPPYSVGEAGFMSGPKRREIGHGKLARRALEAVLPLSLIHI